MAYIKQTWVDLNPSFPLSAARLNHLEDGVAEAANKILVLEAGESVPVGTPSGTIIIRKQA